MTSRNRALSIIAGSLVLVGCDGHGRLVSPDAIDPSPIVSGRITAPSAQGE